MNFDLKHYPRPDGDDSVPFTLDRSRTYDQFRRHDKPDGLWVSVKGDDDWRQWTQSEDFAADTTVDANEHTVTLTERARLLVLGSSLEVLEFTNQFGIETEWSSDGRAYRIDWPLIAAQWDGIIIAPYQWSCRYDNRTLWYYSWDCASGCIWNLDVIASVIAPAGEAAA